MPEIGAAPTCPLAAALFGCCIPAALPLTDTVPLAPAPPEVVEAAAPDSETPPDAAPAPGACVALAKPAVETPPLAEPAPFACVAAAVPLVLTLPDALAPLTACVAAAVPDVLTPPDAASVDLFDVLAPVPVIGAGALLRYLIACSMTLNDEPTFVMISVLIVSV